MICALLCWNKCRTGGKVLRTGGNSLSNGGKLPRTGGNEW